MKSLDLVQAAELLGVHPNTLRERARTGVISGVKIGRAWRFLEDDLVLFMRSLYKEPICPSTRGRTQTSGGRALNSLAVPEYGDQLAKLLVKRRKESTMKSKLNSGKSSLG